MRFLIKSLLMISVIFIELHSQNMDENMDENLQQNIGKPLFSNSVFCIDSIIISANGNYKYEYIYDSTGNIKTQLNEFWSINHGGWVYATKETNVYNANNKILKKLMETWDWGDSVWYKCKQHTYKYDSLGNEILHIRQGARNQVWENELRETGTYNSEGKIIMFLTETSHWSYPKWIKRSRIIYQYNSTSSLLSKHSEYWDDGWYKNGFKYNYTYDEKNNIKTLLIEMRDDSNAVQVELQTYVYDTNNHLLSKIVKKAPERSDCPTCPIHYLPLENYEKHSFSYDTNGNLILHLCKVWEDSVWVRNFKNTFIYNSNNNITLYLSEEWEDNNWNGNIRYRYEYNSNGNMIHFVGEQFIDDNWKRSGGLITFYDSFGNLLKFTASEIKVYYSETTNIERVDLKNLNFSLLQNYPNPFNPSTTISYSLPQSGLVQLKVYDMLGREVASLVNKEQVSGRYQVEFNANNLPSGIYFYTLTSGNFTETKKLILLK